MIHHIARVIRHVHERITGKVPSGSARSSQWAGVRKAWLETNPTCAVCGSLKGPQVHHISPFNVHPELELSDKNFITLCERAGHNHHLDFGHLGDFKSWNPTVVEDAARMLEKFQNKPSTKKAA